MRCWRSWRNFDADMRILDLVLSALGLLLLAPILLAISLLIKLTSPGPALYRAVRIGRAGIPFKLYKFRTMAVGADRLGPGITVAGDRRVTPVGKWLRRAKLDELPQLFNVLKGDMALVGPRPEDPRYVARYTEEQRQVLRVRPGITSPASLRYRDEAALLTGDNWEEVYVTEIMPHKLAVELAYLARRTVWSDLGLVLQTIEKLLSGGSG